MSSLTLHSAGIYKPCLGHENWHFLEIQPKALVFSISNLARRHRYKLV